MYCTHTYLLVGGSRLSYILTVPSAQPATNRERSAVSRARLLTMVSIPAGISWRRRVGKSVYMYFKYNVIAMWRMRCVR